MMPNRHLKLATLEDMENQQSRSHHPQQSRVKYRAVESSQLPHVHSHVGQVIYDLDGNWPRWKRAVLRGFYLPLIRVFVKLGFFPPARVYPDGSFSWVMHQGCFLTEAEARADAARYPHGYVVPNMPLGRSLTESVPEKSAVYFPNHVDEVEDLLLPIREEVKKLKATAQAARAATI